MVEEDKSFLYDTVADVCDDYRHQRGDYVEETERSVGQERDIAILFKNSR